MKLFFRNSKWIVFGLMIFFMGFFSINYVDFKANQLNSNTNFDNINPEKVNNDDKLEPNELKRDKSLDVVHNELIDMIPPPKEMAEKKEAPKNIDNGVKRRFIAYDGGGFGSVNSGVTKCSDSIEIEVVGSGTRMSEADMNYFHMGLPQNFASSNTGFKRHYSMVYAMESEPHSYGGETWNNADFRMWYNLDLSFPEPATYFENKMHLADLLSPPKVDFDHKEKSAHIAWVVSNCNAFNGREKYMKKFMDKLQVDSYGGCLKNKFSHPSEHMTGNIQLFSKYKFVIAIENSNCKDYITEKLVHAVASGSIPIVAGRDGKPDYLRFMPKNSYINLYDYKTIDEAVARIKAIATNRTEYDSFIYFKRSHNYTREELYKHTLTELIDISKTIINPKETFFQELIAKEKSEDKLCKIGRYLKNTPKDVIAKEIADRKMNRPDTSVACLPGKNLGNDFI